MEETNSELGFSPSLPPPQEQDHLPLVGPLPPHLLHPFSPAAGEQQRSACKEIAPLIGPEYS